MIRNLFILLILLASKSLDAQVTLVTKKHENDYLKSNFDVIIEFQANSDSNELFVRSVLDLSNVSNLKRFLIRCKKSLEEIPFNFFQLTQMEKLTIECSFTDSSAVDTVDGVFNSLTNLKELKFEGVPIVKFDKNISFTGLSYFSISHAKIETIPSFLNKENNLTDLHINACPIKFISLESKHFSVLVRLSLINLPIKIFPTSVIKFNNLIFLDLSDCPIDEIPKEIMKMDRLEVLIFGSTNELLIKEPNCSEKVLDKQNLKQISAVPTLQKTFRNSINNWVLNGSFLIRD